MSERARPRRHAERGTAERAAVDAILDEGLVAHVGFAVDGQPFVIPMGYARDGDRLILHGSVKSRLMGALAGGVPACVTVNARRSSSGRRGRSRTRPRSAARWTC